MTLHTIAELAVPPETVKDNFQRYDLLDGQAGSFVKGFFSDTLAFP